MKAKHWKKLAVALVAPVIAISGVVGNVATARADYDPGCETVGWGINLFGNWNQRRTICDGPRNADGTWLRARGIWTPAYYRPSRSYCGSYSCTYTEGGYVPETMQAKETYITSDSTLPPNEPGWLPPGTEIIR